MPREKREPMIAVERGQTKYVSQTPSMLFGVYRPDNNDRFTMDVIITNRYGETMWERNDVSDIVAFEMLQCAQQSDNVGNFRAFIAEMNAKFPPKRAAA